MTDTNQLIERLREYGDDPQDVSDGEWAEWSHKTADTIEGQKKRIEELENRLIWAADRCDAWAQESLDWGWSTHQVKPNKELADDLRRAALAGKGGAG